MRNAPVGALAQLGLARARRLQGDAAEARAAYADFLSLWKDADAAQPLTSRLKPNSPRFEAIAACPCSLTEQNRWHPGLRSEEMTLQIRRDEPSGWL